MLLGFVKVTFGEKMSFLAQLVRAGRLNLGFDF